MRDAAFTSIIDDYLIKYPSEKRDPVEEEDLKKKNIFGYDPVDIQEKIHGRKAPKKKAAPAPPPARRGRASRRPVRANSDLSASDDDDDGRCR